MTTAQATHPARTHPESRPGRTGAAAGWPRFSFVTNSGALLSWKLIRVRVGVAMELPEGIRQRKDRK